MRTTIKIKYFCVLSIVIGVIHFTLETWYHLNFDQSLIQLIADYIGISLLITGGFYVFKNINSKGLLCGAWGYSFCLNYRAFAWRIDEYFAGHSTNLIDNTLLVLSFTLIFSFLAFTYSMILCLPYKKTDY